jgi:hypothetical protein
MTLCGGSEFTFALAPEELRVSDGSVSSLLDREFNVRLEFNTTVYYGSDEFFIL